LVMMSLAYEMVEAVSLSISLQRSWNNRNAHAALTG
jgi:hypothetical protein